MIDPDAEAAAAIDPLIAAKHAGEPADNVRQLRRPRQTYWHLPDLMATTFPERQYVIPGIIGEGLTFLVAPPKMGKSCLARGLSVAKAAGGRAFGRDKLQLDAGPVLLLALEDSPTRLQDAFSRLLGDDAPPAGLHIKTEWPTLPNGGADQIREAVTHFGLKLVIVDVWARLRGPVLDRGSAYSGDYSAAVAVKAVADELAVPILLIHHTRKPSRAKDDADWLDAVNGTQGLAGAADTVLILGRPRNTAGATLKVTSRDVPEGEYALTFDRNVGTWTLLDDPPWVLELHETRQRVLRLFSEGPPRSPADVATALTLTRDNAKQTLRRLRRDGHLDSRDGLYLLPRSPLSPDGVFPGQPGDRGGDS